MEKKKMIKTLDQYIKDNDYDYKSNVFLLLIFFFILSLMTLNVIISKISDPIILGIYFIILSILTIITHPKKIEINNKLRLKYLEEYEEFIKLEETKKSLLNKLKKYNRK